MIGDYIDYLVIHSSVTCGYFLIDYFSLIISFRIFIQSLLLRISIIDSCETSTNVHSLWTKRCLNFDQYKTDKFLRADAPCNYFWLLCWTQMYPDECPWELVSRISKDLTIIIRSELSPITEFETDVPTQVRWLLNQS